MIGNRVPPQPTSGYTLGMREHPWHIRRPTTEHYRWFADLIDLHAITTNWLKSLEWDERQLPHQLKRVATPAVRESLVLLDALAETAVPNQLDSLLDQSMPEELLSRLEQTIWAVQAWTLRNILEKTQDSESDAVRNALEQSSWKSGRDCSTRRWSAFPAEYAGGAAPDLRRMFALLSYSPISGYPNRPFSLIRRSTRDELTVELMSCPHLSSHLEVQPVADALCHLHISFMRGFLYAKNTRILLDRPESQGRCVLVWKLHGDSAASSQLVGSGLTVGA